MEYERIDKPQTGIISPSKLRMKLMGPPHQKKKDGSNSNSSRTSPSKLADSEFVKNNLLASNSEDFDDEVPSLEPSSVNPCNQILSNSIQSDHNEQKRGNGDTNRAKGPQTSRGDGGNMSAVHPVKSIDDENVDYDSNASSSSFEFHKGERAVPKSLSRSFSRPTSYKWNDAEKWIMNKQCAQTNPRSHSLQSQSNRAPVVNTVKLPPEVAICDNRLAPRALDTKRVDFYQPTAQMSLGRFPFPHPGSEPVSVQSSGGNVPIDLYPQSKDLKEVDQSKTVTDDSTGNPSIRAVSMRDMGTEMTPVTSQEPSRTATPVDATTPLRSPTSSIPSTPRRGAPASTPEELTTHNVLQNPSRKGDRQLSEQELKLKTRREIVALGVQLGKMNIAAWASKDEKDMSPRFETTNPEELERIEFEKRAAAWEEAEKSKHAARYKREEIKIQAWEGQQRAKLEAEMRRVEAKVEKMRTHAQAKMMKKITTNKKKSEEKRTAAELQKSRQAEKTAAGVEYIRQTGRIPSSDYACCGLFS